MAKKNAPDTVALVKFAAPAPPGVEVVHVFDPVGEFKTSDEVVTQVLATYDLGRIYAEKGKPSPPGE